MSLNPLSKSLHRHELEKHLKRVLPTLSGRILDVGSKSRRYDKLLPTRPTAIDLQPNNTLDIAPGDVQSLPFPDESFDSIVCLEVLEYIESPRKAAVELYRVLAPGGTLVVSTPFLVKVHDDRMRYTDKRLAELFSTFKSAEILPIGNFYLVILDLLRGKILDQILPLRIVLSILWLPLCIFLPFARISKDTRYTSGYLVIAKK